MSDKQLTPDERDAIRRKLWAHRPELQPRTVGVWERVKIAAVKRATKTINGLRRSLPTEQKD